MSGDWKSGTRLFSDAELWGYSQIPNKFKCLPFAGILGDAPPHDWAGDLDQLIFKGNFFIDEVFFFHKKSRTVLAQAELPDVVLSGDRKDTLHNSCLRLADHYREVRRYGRRRDS
jgi:hypothetical protein